MCVVRSQRIDAQEQVPSSRFGEGDRRIARGHDQPLGQIGGVSLKETVGLALGDRDLWGSEQLEEAGVEVGAQSSEVELVGSTGRQILAPPGDAIGDRTDQPGALKIDLQIVDDQERAKGETLARAAHVEDALDRVAVEGDGLCAGTTGDERHAEVDGLFEQVDDPTASDRVQEDLLVGSIEGIGLIEMRQSPQLLEHDHLRIDVPAGLPVEAEPIKGLPADPSGAPSAGPGVLDGSHSQVRLPGARRHTEPGALVHHVDLQSEPEAFGSRSVVVEIDGDRVSQELLPRRALDLHTARRDRGDPIVEEAIMREGGEDQAHHVLAPSSDRARAESLDRLR